jgi:hypothetical protein
VFGRAAPSCSPFGDLISHVLSWRAQEQMSGITTGRIVATMADKEPIGDRPIDEFIDDAMHSPIPFADGELPIATWEATALPLPTRIGTVGLVNTRPNILGPAALGVCPAPSRAIEAIAISQHRWIRQKGKTTRTTTEFHWHEKTLLRRVRSGKGGAMAGNHLVESLATRFLAPLHCMGIIPNCILAIVPVLDSALGEE